MSSINYSFYELLCIFIIYSFIGWSVEVIYAATIQGKFVNRGFCTGPVCPIYGVGVICVLIFLEPIKDKWWLLFVESIFFTSSIEFIGGFILEKFFHEKWWDYSEEPFNIKGYICLRFSLLWGMACVLVVNVIHPTVMVLIWLIPKTIGYIAVGVLWGTFLADFTITIVTILKLRRNLRSIMDIEDRLKKISETIGMNLSSTTLSVMEHGEKFKENLAENEEKFKEAVTDKFSRIEEMRDNIADKRADLESEIDALNEKLRLNVQASQKRFKRLGSAFPSIEKGRYYHIFKK